MPRFLRYVATLILSLAVPAFADSPREHLLFNDGWRCTKDDPAGVNSADLLYDVRPTGRQEEERQRRAEDTADAQKPGAATSRILKPWILPTGNAFLKDASKYYKRPEGNPGDDVSFVQSTFDDSAWLPVTLPHDWAIAGPFHKGGGGVGGGMGRLPSPGIGWYRKKFTLPASDAGKSIFLDIDGAMSYSVVWLNEKLVGGWPYGYSSYRLDLTPYLMPGENQLAIRLDNPTDFSRWYPGAGLYRNVWLTIVSPVHIGQWGTCVTTRKISKDAATIQLETTLDNDSKTSAELTIASEIFALDAAGQKMGDVVAKIPDMKLSVAAGASAKSIASVELANPKLWGPPPQQQPNRYVAVTTVSQAGKVVDQYETRFGVRQIAFKPDGVFVNGERIRIQGVNQHHDLGALGAAFNTRAAERQLEILRDMGCNAIRFAHNPPAPEMLELTDRMGFLVLDELFDAWVRRKTPFDFHLIFNDWHEQDLRAWITRDRNHPSVMLWSVGNEVGEQYTGEPGAIVARELVAMAHEQDPTRPVTASMNFAKPDSPFAAAMDVISLNYQGEGIRDTPEYASFGGLKTPPQYQSFRDKFPDRTILSTESAAALSSRGVYLFPVASGISNPTRDQRGGDARAKQVSAYELYAADFGSSPDKVFAAQDRNPFVAGEFVWSGFDYLGEPTPYYDARSSYFGIIDLAGFPKDRFYLYQSRWRPDLRFAHILPHWTWPDRVGEVTPVHVFTSADEAELFVNGKSQGRKKRGEFEYRFRWDEVIYEPGELKVETWKLGQPWATSITKTAGAPAKLEAIADRDTIYVDGRADGGEGGVDLSFVTVRITDAQGITAPRATNRITFRIEGAGEIVGEIVATDNGDPTDFDPFGSPQRAAFNGLCLAIVRPTPQHAGTITLHAHADGLRDATVEIRTITIARPER